MNTINKGDLITVVKDDYRQKKNAKLVVIQSPGFGEGNGIGTLRNKEIYSIEYSDFSNKLSSLGADIGHYTLRAEKIESIAFPADNPDIIRINGDIDIPDPSRASHVKKSVLDTFFFDEMEAKDIATQLNEVELERIIELQDLVTKARENMEDVVNNKRV